MIVLIIALYFVLFVFKNLKIFKEDKMGNLLIFAALVSLILEVFPIKSTGSIFTTNNTTYIILISSIILNYRKMAGIEKI